MKCLSWFQLRLEFRIPAARTNDLKLVAVKQSLHNSQGLTYEATDVPSGEGTCRCLFSAYFHLIKNSIFCVFPTT